MLHEHLSFWCESCELVSAGVFATLLNVPKKEGLLGLYKGNGAMMVRIFPYGAIQFMAFDKYKKVFIRLITGKYARMFIFGGIWQTLDSWSFLCTVIISSFSRWFISCTAAEYTGWDHWTYPPPYGRVNGRWEQKNK